MKSVLTSLFLAFAALVASAQEPIFLSQSFQLSYNRWQLNQEAASSTTLATYNFGAELPVVTYRLGAFALTGDLDYNRYADGSSSQSSLGLNHYGMKAALFPYQPFHISLDYSHSQSPGLLGLDRVQGDIYGIGLNYRGQVVQDLQISLREGRTSQTAQSEDWSLATLGLTQHFGQTIATFQANHQDFSTSGLGLQYQSNYLYGSTDTKFSNAWSFRTNLSLQDQSGDRSLITGADLIGNLGKWISLSSLLFDQEDAQGSRASSTSASQSLSYSVNRYTLYGTAALSSLNAGAGNPSSTQGTLDVGGAYSLSPNWRVFGDLSVSQVGETQTNDASATASTGTTRAFHIGVARGGDIPALMKHTLFYLTDLRFARRVQNDYPPGYVPSELAQDIQQRRIRQSGNLGFSGELFHVLAPGDTKLDWLKVTGDLKLWEGLRVFAMGDLKQDEGLTQTGVRQDDKDFSLNASQVFGKSSLSGSMGFTRSDQSVIATPTTGAQPAAPGPIDNAGTSKFYTLAFNSRAWIMPYGVLWTRYSEPLAPPTTAISANMSLDFRQVSLRVSYEVARRNDGFRSSRVTVDLLRWFDTIALYGFGQR